tara:strand:- start:4811 stop:5587 length:777 start_codon:yes stop_codon:yes gene_type:complete
MISFESQYLQIMEKILTEGQERKTRNSVTRSIFAPQLVVEDLRTHDLPLLSTRKMFTKGVIGEYAAILKGASHVNHFESMGCNYWKLWAEEDGSLELDYGKGWKPQFEHVIDSLKNNPGDRRMLVNTWNYARLDELSLPCCHYAYQFYANGKHVDMLWQQRSADWAVGVPSDILFASAMLISLAAEVGMEPGTITMQFGDAHLYEPHFDKVEEQLKRHVHLSRPSWKYTGDSFFDFLPSDLEVMFYHPDPAIKYQLIA